MSPQGRKAEWFDEESFWVECWSFLFPDERLAEAGEEAEKLLQLVPNVGKDVLDLCCGPGRHSVALARRGLRVTGVDRTTFLLDKARDLAAEKGVTVEWVQADMRDFDRPAAFDLAISMFSSFGYFENKDEDLRVLEKIHRNLRPGGACLMEMMGKEVLAAEFISTMSDRLQDGATLVRRHEVIDDWTRLHNEWIVVRGGKAHSFKLDLTVYSGQEIRDRLEQAGFRTVRLFGDLDGNPYGPKATRLVALAIKELDDA